MVKRKLEPVLAEILEAIEGIQTHTAGKSLEDFSGIGYYALPFNARWKSYPKPAVIFPTKR